MPTTHRGSLELGPKGKLVPWIVDLPTGDDDSSTLAVCLAHGAGGDASSGNLAALAAACAASGVPCLRFTARGGSLQHRIDVAKALLAAAPTLPGLQHVQRWILAGHSMGARIAASIAGEQPPPVPVSACLLLSYPLHPPGRPAELRDALLHQLRLPTLLVRGSRDPFSTQERWDAALRGMHAACAWRQHTVEGGDHGLKIGGRSGVALSVAALQGVCAGVQQFVRQVGQGQELQKRQQEADGQPADGQLAGQRDAAASGGRRGRRQTAGAPTAAGAAAQGAAVQQRPAEAGRSKRGRAAAAGKGDGKAKKARR